MTEKKTVDKEVVKEVVQYKSGDITKLAILLLLMMIIFILGIGIGLNKRKHHYRKENYIENKSDKTEKNDDKVNSEAEESQIELPPIESKKPAIEEITEKGVEEQNFDK